MDHLSTKTSSTFRARFVDKNQGEKEGVDLRSEEEGRRSGGAEESRVGPNRVTGRLKPPICSGSGSKPSSVCSDDRQPVSVRSVRRLGLKQRRTTVL